MTTRTKPSFLRLFLGGFALGAACLIGVQATQADIDLVPAAIAAPR